MEEGRSLQRITRTARDPVKLRRAIVVMMSTQGQSVPNITSLMQVTDDYARDVIHAFNERGFEAWAQNGAGARPPTISQDTRERICLIARTVPAERGITGMSTWSLRTRAAHLADRKVVASISREHLGRILRKAGVSWQSTTTWKPTISTSSPTCRASWTCANIRLRTAGWSASMSSGR
jgi:transposase